MTPLRFCFVTTFYPPFNFGGDGIAVQRFAQAFARRGHRVTVVHDADAFTVLGGKPQAEPHAAEGIEIVTLRTALPLVNTLLTHQLGSPVANRRRLEAVLSPGAFDVIFFNNISLAGGPGLLAFGRGALKLYLAHEHWLVCPTHVLWRHNREPCDARQCLRCQLSYRRPPQWWRHTGLLERRLRHVDAFIAFSEFSRQKHREFGFRREMEVLPLFLPYEDGPAVHERPHARPYFLFVGRLERLKGLQDVIPAFVAGEGADLVVAGDGAYADELRRLASGSPRVRFAGRLADEELRAFYRHALALIAPSLGFETFGLSVIESFRAGLPVIARRIGPLPEILERSGGGVLFESGAELVDALRLIQADAGQRQAMGQRGCAAFRALWSEEAVVPRYLDLIARLRTERERPAAGAHARADTDDRAE
jgi:glycosyltransferase involved in cell wall biosynthesis